MGKLGCSCGHVISDGTDNLPYKARVLPDLNDEQFFDWVAERVASYVEAVQQGRVEQWLSESGFGPGYAELNLGHRETLSDLIYSRFLSLQRGIYECEACGRVHIETREQNHFVSYAPDSGRMNAVLATGSED